MSEQGFLAQGKLVSADFTEKTLEMHVEGDMPTVRAGRYVIVEADQFRRVTMLANLWREQEGAKRPLMNPRHRDVNP